MNYPKKVRIGDITVRDGFQHEEKFIPTAVKCWLAEELLLCGFRNIEVTNFGNPKRMPQFKDADTLFKMIRKSKRIAHLLPDTQLTAVTINRQAIERAIEARKEGCGPDRILLMVSTSESHQLRNSGLTIDQYFRMAEKYVPIALDVGLQVNGTISTVWGCPIEGPTEMKKAIAFTQRWFSIGVSDVEHADHDGSASPDRVYRYFSRILDEFQDPHKHIVHLHTTRGWGLANIVAALQAGMTNYESTMGGIGGQPAIVMDGIPVSGTGAYYYNEPTAVGLVATEDMVVMMDEMGIKTNLNIDRLLKTGKKVEEILGRKLRSESIHQGRIPKHALTGIDMSRCTLNQ